MGGGVNSVYKKLCILKEHEKRSEIKFWTFELTTLEINAIQRIPYFFWYCLNKRVNEFNNFNIGTVKQYTLLQKSKVHKFSNPEKNFE